MIKSVDKEVLQLMAEGFNTKEIAALMSKPESTIETYRHRLYNRLGVRNGPHCIAYAFRNKILS